MKKIYLLFTLLLSMLGATTAFAEEVTIQLTQDTGEWTVWNSNANNPWATQWTTFSKEPLITLTSHPSSGGGTKATDAQGNTFNGNNNMRYWDNLNIKMFNSPANDNGGHKYEVTVSPGWYIKSVSFDFRSESANGIEVIMADQDEVASTGPDDVQSVSYENEEDNEDLTTVPFIAMKQHDENTFIQTSNFIVVVKKLGEAKTALAELLNAISKYEGEKFLTGEGPGNYGQAEVEAFQAAIEAAYEAENADDGTKTDEELAALYRSLAQNIVDAYEAVLASRNTEYSIPDGYYRIKTGQQYTASVVVDKDEETGEEITETQIVDKYMLSALEGEKIYGRWGSVENLDADCSSLWKITKKEDGYDFQNMGTDARFTNVATSTNVVMSLTSENLMAIEPAGTLDNVTYANIRVSTQESDKAFYLHQGGHGGGTGTGSYLVGWYTTAGFTNDEWKAAGSEWTFVPVDEATAEAIIKNYEPTKDELLMKERYKLMVPEVYNKLVIVKQRAEVTINEDKPLITDNDQFSSPFTSEKENVDGEDPKCGTDMLLDGNTATYWHSEWGTVTPYHTHYLQVALVEPVNEEIALTITRRPVAANHITIWGVEGSNDAEAETWESLASLWTPYGNNTETLTTLPFDTKGYKYLRFYIDRNSSGNGYGHVSEFQLHPATLTKAAPQYTVMGDAATNLDKVFREQQFIDVSKLTAEQYNAMKTAYDAFLEKFVNPSELRETLEDVADIAEGIVVGTQPGYWTDENAAATLTKTITDATAYDVAGAYTQEQSDKYVADLKAQADAVYAAAIQIQEGKWYRIRFASEEDFDEHGWNKNAGYVAPAEDQPEIDAPLFGKYVTVANKVVVDEETKEYELELFDEEDVATFIGKRLYFMEDKDITNKDMSMFRFIAVGDSAYLMQNKATGLFLKIATLNIQPSVYKPKAVGYGLSIIASRNLIGGASENYLHGQKTDNVLVTWDATAPGSASAMYIEEAGDVAADYSCTANLAIQYGAMNAFCYPFEITNIKDGKAWGVSSVEDNKISLCEINGAINAGRPFIFINGETEDYNEEEEAEPIAFTFNPSSIAIEPKNGSALKGTYSTVRIDRGDVYCKGNALVVNEVAKEGIMIVNPTYVSANSAYIVGETPLDPKAEVEIDWTGVDGIQTALQNVSKSGIIYTLDGRIAGKGNLNNVKGLGRGIYILNGVKVVVK